MSKKTRGKPRPTPKQNAITTFLTSMEGYDTLCITGYTRLSDNPEVMMAVSRIADLIGSMTIHLMQNTAQGDVRLQNGLSRKLDIEPSRNMTRKTFLSALVRIMLLEGQGNAVVYPELKEGAIDNLVLLKPTATSFHEAGDGYVIRYGTQEYGPEEALHFVTNPDPEHPWKGQGYRVALKDVVQNLKQAAATKKGFMESRWKPSVIIRVNSETEALTSEAGRDTLLEDYIATSEAGKPWVIPSELMDVQSVKPLSLTDLALNDAVTLDKRTVAGIFNVPPFVVGAGEFNRDEWNNFINATIFPLARAIEQEFTKKLLLSPDLYFRFNVRSLYSYSLDEIIGAGSAMVDRMAMRRNEWRDWIGLQPDNDMNELLALENYIPADRLGDQRKLNPRGETGGATGSAAPAAGGATPVTGETVAEVSLNGAQIQSLLSIVQAVAANTLQYKSAITLITSAFPFDASTAKEILGDPSKLNVEGGAS